MGDAIGMQVRVGPPDDSANELVLHGETREWLLEFNDEEESLHDTAPL